MTHWGWCSDDDALMVMNWRWCSDGDALKVMQWRWCTERTFPVQSALVTTYNAHAHPSTVRVCALDAHTWGAWVTPEGRKGLLVFKPIASLEDTLVCNYVTRDRLTHWRAKNLITLNIIVFGQNMATRRSNTRSMCMVNMNPAQLNQPVAVGIKTSS